MTRCYLRYGDATLGDADPFDTIGAAVRAFERYAEDCDRFGQSEPEATLHLRDERQHDEPKCCEDPDLALSRGPRGGIRRTRW